MTIILPKINSSQSEVNNSASIDLEWIPYKGRYAPDKTKIFAASLCTNLGDRYIFHISRYASEKDLIQNILFYFNQFSLTFGWYSNGIAVYDNDDDNEKGNQVRGRDSDFFILHQRCHLYGLKSPFEIKKTYVKLVDSTKNHKHIDLYSVFSKKIIQDNVFEGKYRSVSLDNVSQALLGIGKYNKINAGVLDISYSLPVEEQKRYVKRDAELVMLLAQYNNCLALKIMKVFSKYSEMDYHSVCHTNVSRWYAHKYRKMLERGECTVAYTPNYVLPKEKIAGGHHTEPLKQFFVNSKVYELDVKGQYPNIVISNNFSFDTLDCTCCKYREDAQINLEIINTINEQLQKNNINRRVDKYWICQRFKGAFPQVLEQVLSDRDRYLGLLKQEKAKDKPNFKLIEEYQTHQLGAKLFANAGAGLFGDQYFEFSNYKVNECITAEGRRIHKQMELMGQNDNYNFQIVFGFTDSIFVSNVQDDDMVDRFIQDCKDKLNATVELKNVFLNSIFYGKKNRFVAYIKDKDETIIKGLDGLSGSNPQWIKKWFERILFEIVKHPETRFQSVPFMLKEAFSDLDNGRFNAKEELRFTQRLGKYVHEYNEHVQVKKLATLLGKDKDDLVHYYYTEIDINTKNKSENKSKKKTKTKLKKKKCFSIEPNNLSFYQYKNLLLSKLKDTLEITGFDYSSLKSMIDTEDQDQNLDQDQRILQVM